MTQFTKEDIQNKKQVLKDYTDYSEDKIEELAKNLTSAEIVALVLKTATFHAHGLMSYTPMTFNLTPPPTNANVMDIRSMYPTSLIPQKDPYKEIVRPKD